MSMQERVYVMDRLGHHKAILQGIDWSTFCASWEKGSQYQLDFTCYVTDSFGYTLLTNENIVEFRGQQYVIKTYNPQYADGYDGIQISATHIGYECQYIVHAAVKSGAVSMSIEDAMHWLFDGNVKNFDWEIRGNFTNRTLTDFGNVDAKTGLSTIKQYWSCEVTFDNTHVIVWSHDEYLHKISKSIRYQHDTDQIQLTGDSTSIVNKLYCVGATDDNNNPKYFQPFWVMDNDSIQKWGDKTGAIYSNDNVTTASAMESEARSSMQLNPQFSVQITYYGSDIPDFGAQVYLEVLPMNVQEWVEVTGYKIYPFDHTQNGEIDLNSLKPNILSINNSLQDTVTKAVNNAMTIHSASNVTNESQDTYNVNNDNMTGTVDVLLSNSMVFVDFQLSNLEEGSITTFSKAYHPSYEKEGLLIVNSGGNNYTLSYSVGTDGDFQIGKVQDMSGNNVDKTLDKVSGSFNYLV